MADDPQQRVEKELMTWEFPSHERPNRTPVWYVAAAILVVLLLIYAVVTSNFLFAVIVVIVAVLLTFNAYDQPQLIRFSITEKGILLGDRGYDFDEMKSFWVIYNPPTVKTLYLSFRSALRPDLPVRLLDQNPILIRALLLRFLPEDTTKENENLTDVLNRTFKL